MATERVRPGEIISSELMNFVLQKLEDLDNIVNSLGQLNRVRIDEFDPPEEVPVGEMLTVKGANFAHPPSENLVLVAGREVTEFFAPSTSAMITFRVPESIQITDNDGELVIVSITNQEFGHAESTYRLLPPVSGPAPIISTVTTQDGSTILKTGQPAIIVGDHFAANPQNNVIKFQIVVSGGVSKTYTVADDAIDVGSSDEQQIKFTVPIIIEIPLNQQRPVTLKVRVGQKEGIKEGVPVRRIA